MGLLGIGCGVLVRGLVASVGLLLDWRRRTGFLVATTRAMVMAMGGVGLQGEERLESPALMLSAWETLSAAAVTARCSQRCH